MTAAGDKRDLREATVIVTGAGSGVGMAVCEQLDALRANVVLVGRNDKTLRQTAKALTTRHDIIAGDVGDSAFCDSVVAKTQQTFGTPLLLVNSAGIIHRATAEATSDAAWSSLMRTNVDGVFYMSRACAVVMRRATAGAIVNVGSTLSVVGAAGLAAYCASKGAVAQLTRAMALECADAGITVNAVCPGAIDSPMLYSEHPAGTVDATVKQLNAAAIPTGSLATPAQVARAVVFLATEPHINGALLSVDGGYTTG